MNNIRTMKYLGEDFWGRPVYKCIETGRLWKDITLGSLYPELYTCNNDYEGEPDCPINPRLEIKFVDLQPQITEEEKFNYQLLGRLISDCNYYLGTGRYAKQLWAGNEKRQIDKMKELYNSFSDAKKPEWITMEQILEYERLMCN